MIVYCLFSNYGETLEDIFLSEGDAKSEMLKLSEEFDRDITNYSIEQYTVR